MKDDELTNPLTTITRVRHLIGYTVRVERKYPASQDMDSSRALLSMMVRNDDVLSFFDRLLIPLLLWVAVAAPFCF